MPAISKIRFTNVIYEDGNKRYNDDMFHFDGENGAILLENGGGKTVFIQTALQAILPHTSLADRKIKETLKLEEGPAHVGIEWIVSDKPRRYAVTAVSLFLGQDKVDSYRFVDEYRENDPNSLAEIPFVQESSDGKRPAGKGEIHDYYKGRTSSSGELFDTLTSFKEHIEDHYGIITKEWENIVKINSAEGGVEAYFDQCKTSKQLFEQLLIPTVENALAANDGDSFVDTFSTRRKGFKEYQQFQETIQENKLIQEKLEHYVDVFARKKGRWMCMKTKNVLEKPIPFFIRSVLNKLS
ncbi:hypothetical protein JCM9140_1356 [Halalkalibacter wakoensis JCM 9140]|uniref:Uncharacterized protein n=1 Tax=Halalkalibacter wakoensis JCM 9140 TaxID=1236970 RepID=W4Q093_9BACI|nr:hypothetical protein [Halalkalibacter wakoensis]GAE25365.1 hypothetical protein JCM9140_1356 [Halalkalibacter wakoensis JCM 9140]